MNHSPFALITGTVLADSFRLDTLLGQGGYGLTYGGQDLKLHRPVAIKEFFPAGCGREGTSLRASSGWQSSDIDNGRTRFLEEGRALARFRHEGIVPVYSAFEANDTAYLVMEWLQGQTLSQIVEANHSPLPVTEAIEVLLKVADALSHVHEVGLLHRDIKPDNVLRSDDGRVVLLDFGLATDFNRRGHHTTRQLQTVLSGGTPGYAPLEQYSQRADLTPATDVYALSATLYFLLTGQDPLPATDRIIGATLPEPHTLNPNVPLTISSIVLEGMALEVARRPASVKEWAHRLQTSRTQPSITNPRPLSPQSSAPTQPTLFASTPKAAPTASKILTPLAMPASLQNKWEVEFAPQQHHERCITDLHFAPSQGAFGSHLLATAGKDGQVLVWDAEGKTSVRNFDHPASVHAVRFSVDGRLVFVGCDDRRLYVWEVEGGQTAHISDKFKYPIVSLAVSPTGGQIAIGCGVHDPHSDKWQGFLFDGEGQKLHKTLPTDDGRILSLDYSHDGRWLVQATFGAYTVWDAHSGRRAYHFDAYDDSAQRIQCVRFSPDSKYLVTNNIYEPTKCWEAFTGELVRSFAKIKSPQKAIAFSPQPPLIALAGEDSGGNINIFLLDSKSGQQLQNLHFFPEVFALVEAMAFSADGQLLAAGGGYNDAALCIYSKT